ncbi:hypothetical protein IAT38_004635 [Cryptococcus sp. DSM 104549]
MPPFGSRGGSSRGRGGGGGRGRGGSGRGGRGGSRYGGPQLPSALLEQVDAAYGSGGRREATRKEKRKAARDEKRGPAQRAPRRDADHDASEDDDEDRPPAKKPKTSKDAPADKPAPEKPEKKKKKKLPELRLPDEVPGGDAEDKEIEWLEFMLRKEKNKGKGKGDEEEIDDDGLDDLLDFVDNVGKNGKGLDRTAYEDESDDEEVFGGFGDSEDEEEEDDDDEEEEQDEEEEDGEDEGEKDEEDANEIDRNEDESVDGDSSQPGDDSPPSAFPAEPTDTLAASAATDAPAPTKYVPPHLRAAQLEENAKGNKQKAEELVRLERKAQGLLNKLSEANLETILAEVEGLYRGHSRNDVSTTLTTLIIQMISDKANLLDSFVVLYATLVGALHRVIGMEFGAHFIHTLITRYHNLSTNPSSSASAPTTIQATIYETPDASKESLNLLTLIAELYNAQVVGSKLIYDLVRGFLESEGKEGEVMGEREVEGLLKILRCSGAQLRTDDPASLKDIVALVQDKTKGKEKTMTARARFLVETLTNVKNGKVKSTAGSEAGNDAAQRMKRFLSGLGKKRRLLAYEPLRVSLADLLSADKKGKWWLVGAGWSGNPLVELEQQQQEKLDGKGKASGKGKEKEKDREEALLELARKQGMNTDVRRGVFVVLMTSEDYAHACERLSLFKLSDVQQREFVRVALHCCGLESTYNPYYTLILNHLTANSYDHRFTLQYALWDFMRELEGGSKVGKQRVGNVARAVAYVVARGGMDLTAFKAVDFTSLTKPLTRFLTAFLLHFLISLQTVSPIFVLSKSFKPADYDDEIVQEKFEKALSNTELAGGWLWVLDREMKGWEGELEGKEREKEVVRRGIKEAKGVLSAVA